MFKDFKEKVGELCLDVFVVVSLAITVFDGDIATENKIIVSALLVLVSLGKTITLQLTTIIAYLELVHHQDEATANNTSVLRNLLLTRLCGKKDSFFDDKSDDLK